MNPRPILSGLLFTIASISANADISTAQVLNYSSSALDSVLNASGLRVIKDSLSVSNSYVDTIVLRPSNKFSKSKEHQYVVKFIAINDEGHRMVGSVYVDSPETPNVLINRSASKIVELNSGKEAWLMLRQNSTAFGLEIVPTINELGLKYLD